MIRKSLLIAFGVFIAYNLFLLIKVKANRPVYVSAYQRNIIKADRYLYDDKFPQGVMIGTSLSSRVITDSLKIYNLAMPGMSPFDGLYVLTRSKAVPKFVFIEINYFYKPEREEFIQSFSSPAAAFLKLELPALRVENQPIGMSYNIAEKHHGGYSQLMNKPILDTSLFNMRRKTYALVDPAFLESCIIKLKWYVADLSSRGCKVCFFEMPVNKVFEHMASTGIVRHMIQSNFPQCPFIPVPGKLFITTDGIHLGEREALDYTMYFKGQLQRLGYQ